MKNGNIKADVLRELSNVNGQDNELLTDEADVNEGTATQYSGNTFLHRDTMTGPHSSGTVFAQMDAKILSNKQRTSSSEQPFDDINS